MKLSLRLERELKTLDALEDLGYTCRNLEIFIKSGIHTRIWKRR